MEKNQKYEFSKWSMIQLRDVINTSCNVELLEASRIEINQRLNILKDWKDIPKGKSKDYHQPAGETSYAPSAPPECDLPIIHERYFKIPFTSPYDNQTNKGKHGWWYSHFNGQSLVREMELQPNKPPVLLIAGMHNVCDMSLEETGLTKKGNAEITNVEFDYVWKRNGGDVYRG